MEESKTRPEVTDDGKLLTSKKINIRKRFLQGDSYSPVGFCLTEVPISMLTRRLMAIQWDKETKKESKEHIAYLLTT